MGPDTPTEDEARALALAHLTKAGHVMLEPEAAGSSTGAPHAATATSAVPARADPRRRVVTDMGVPSAGCVRRGAGTGALNLTPPDQHADG